MRRRMVRSDMRMRRRLVCLYDSGSNRYTKRLGRYVTIKDFLDGEPHQSSPQEKVGSLFFVLCVGASLAYLALAQSECMLQRPMPPTSPPFSPQTSKATRLPALRILAQAKLGGVTLVSYSLFPRPLSTLFSLSLSFLLGWLGCHRSCRSTESRGPRAAA